MEFRYPDLKVKEENNVTHMEVRSKCQEVGSERNSLNSCLFEGGSCPSLVTDGVRIE